MKMIVQSEKSFDQIYLAFDIHDVLAETTANDVAAPLFQAYGMLLQVPVEGYSKPVRNYIYPFVKELFQLLAQTPGVHIGFSTSSKEAFAKPFVQLLLINALGQEKYIEIADKVHICAEGQLRKNSAYKEMPYSKYAAAGNYKKDLDDVFPCSTIPKQQRLLIEDNASFAAPHQVKNLFKVSGCGWADALQKYRHFGYHIYFYASYDEFEKSRNNIESQRSIALYLKQITKEENISSVFVIAYYDGKRINELELSLEESIKIKGLYDKSALEFQAHIYETCSEKSMSETDNYPNDEIAIINEIRKTKFEGSSSSKEYRVIMICGQGMSPKDCVFLASRGKVVIHLREGDADIYFPENHQESVSLKSNGYLKLITHAKNYWESECKKKNHVSKAEQGDSKARLYNMVWERVKNLVWKERVIYQANHILLVTGAIFNAWEESKKTERPISEILFSWQCEGEKGFRTFNPAILKKRTELYAKGLELLQKINPLLQPITLKSFESAQEKFPNLPEDGAQEQNESCLTF